MRLRTIPTIDRLKSRVDQAVGFRDALVRQNDENQREIKKLQNQEALLGLVAQLLRVLADAEVSTGIEAVTKLQSEGLQEIFDDKDLTLEANITESRGKVSVELFTVDRKPNGMVIKDDPTEFGGAVQTVESVLLRIIVIMRRGFRPILVLDETLKAVQKNYLDRLVVFLTTMCERIPGGMDILAVSHDPVLIDSAQKAYYIHEERDGSATFKERK